MTTPRDCRPPDGTPNGTVCWIVQHTGGGRRMCALPWHAPDLWEFGGFVVRAKAAAERGWRFHSIAEPPHGQ